VSLDLYLVRPNRAKVDSQYLFAFLTLPATQALLASGKQGSALAKVKVPLPSLHTQRQIAELACSFAEEGMILKKLSDLNLILSREVVARAISPADATNHKRSNK
jgi:hypothetical protein